MRPRPKFPIRLRPMTALSLSVLVMAARCECDPDPMDPPCIAQLKANYRAALDAIYRGDVGFFEALWDGTNTAGCPTDFTWSVTGNSIQLDATTGQTVTARAVQVGQSTVSVTAGGQTGTLPVNVRRDTGDLNPTIAGLPTGVPGNIIVTGPNNFTGSVTGNTTILNLAAGNYNYTLNDVTGLGIRYAGRPPNNTGGFTINKDEVTNHTFRYDQWTPRADFTAQGVPSSIPGPFGSISGPGGSRSITASPQTFNLDVGSFTANFNPVDPNGFRYNPTQSTRTFNLNPFDNFDLSVLYNATRGELVVNTPGLATGATAPSTISGPSGTTMPPIPGRWYRDIGMYTVLPGQVNDFRNTVSDRFEDYKPSQSTFSINVQAALTATLNIPFTQTAWSEYQNITWGMPTGIVAHHQFLGGIRVVGITLDNTLNSEPPPAGGAVAVGMLRVTGPPEWVTLNGTLNDDGTFSVSGSGTVAGFPNVPIVFTGTLASTGQLTGSIKIGSDTPPTGLPTGSITYPITGTRAQLAASR